MPLVGARYTRAEILAAFDIGTGAKPRAWREGVLWDEASGSDLFAFTLDKSAGSFSPTTRYRDYAISPELIHWESQSGTSLDSNTGRRYVSQAERGTNVVLFARLSTSDRAFWCLGPATYVSHEGERPIAITWRLHHKLPGDLFAEFAAAVAAAERLGAPRPAPPPGRGDRVVEHRGLVLPRRRSRPQSSTSPQSLTMPRSSPTTSRSSPTRSHAQWLIRLHD